MSGERGDAVAPTGQHIRLPVINIATSSQELPLDTASAPTTPTASRRRTSSRVVPVNFGTEAPASATISEDVTQTPRRKSQDSKAGEPSGSEEELKKMAAATAKMQRRKTIDRRHASQSDIDLVCLQPTLEPKQGTAEYQSLARRASRSNSVKRKASRSNSVKRKPSQDDSSIPSRHNSLKVTQPQSERGSFSRVKINERTVDLGEEAVKTPDMDAVPKKS
ncbi:hypothetical protein HDU99_005537, partial [Rhizoclosmatium hyalinum]